MNDLFLQLRIEAFKPVLTSLLLPPLPLLLLMLIGATALRRWRMLGWTLLIGAAAGIWLSTTEGAAEALQRLLVGEMRPLAPQQLRARGGAAPPGVIVVLGGGREPMADEYGSASLSAYSLQRLRYGLWLSRESGLPVGYSGGVGHGQTGMLSEADVASRIAAREFARPLSFTEPGSRDTRENAANTVALLRAAGIERIVLVTHAWHMPRSRRAFEQAIAQHGGGIEVLPAPMGLARSSSTPVLRWLPSAEGYARTRHVLREMLGLLGGA